MVGRVERESSFCIRHCGNYMNNHSQIFLVEVEFPFEFDGETLDIVGVDDLFCKRSYHIGHFSGEERGEKKRAGCPTPIGQPWREFGWQKKAGADSRIDIHPGRGRSRRMVLRFKNVYYLLVHFGISVNRNPENYLCVLFSVA